jgi:hypothetical protein
MKITSDIISTNLFRLEKAQKEFPKLLDYQKVLLAKKGDSLDQYLVALSKRLKDECISYGLRPYIEFIEFSVESNLRNQELFYKNKIKNKDFQSVLVSNAIDDDAKKSFKSKTKSTFEKLINSKKWDVFIGNVYNRRRSQRRYTNNLIHSSAIIANYLIQNEIEILSENTGRVNKFYLQLIPVPDLTIKEEIKRTKEITDFVITKLSESGADFRKVNHEHLTRVLNEELKKRILSIEPGEKIKCIEKSPETTGLTINKVYDVISKSFEAGILKVTIKNDFDRNLSYHYRFFETITNLRDSALDELLNDL